MRKIDHLPDAEYVSSIRGRPIEGHFTPSRKQATHEKFAQEMRDFYTHMAANGLPPRPEFPNIPAPKKTSDVIADAFRTAPGLVFGESHSSLAAFRTLYDNVDVFVQNKVKAIRRRPGVRQNHALERRWHGPDRAHIPPSQPTPDPWANC